VFIVADRYQAAFWWQVT